MISNEPVVQALSRLLADTHTLYLKTHNYRWNVTDPMFNTLVAHSEADFTHGMCSGCQEQMRQRISAGQRPSEAPAS